MMIINLNNIINFITKAMQKGYIVVPESEEYLYSDDAFDMCIKVIDNKNQEYNFQLYDCNTLIFSTVYGSVEVELTRADLNRFRCFYDQVIEYSKQKTEELFNAFFASDEEEDKSPTIDDLDED